jgi:hypothetical protein
MIGGSATIFASLFSGNKKRLRHGFLTDLMRLAFAKS